MRFSKIFLNTFLCKTLIFPLWSKPIPRIMIWTNSNFTTFECFCISLCKNSPPSLLPPPTVAPSPVDHDLIQLISTLHKDVSTEVGIRFWRKRFLKDNKFLITLNIFFWKRARHFVLKIELNSLNPRLLCASFGWNYPCGSGEKLNIDR